MFNKVVVVGTGSSAAEVLKLALKCGAKYRYETEYIEYGTGLFNPAIAFARKNEICCHEGNDHKRIYDSLMRISTNVRTLIININSFFIYPAILVNRDNVVIVNLHNALSPEFPGRNAATWSIFYDKAISGITWHYVNEDIDGGDIIIQKTLELHEDIKAYELVHQQMKLAIVALKECYEDILVENVIPQAQKGDADKKIYKSNEIPGGGKFGIDDDPRYIYRLLRSMDYGKGSVFPRAKTIVGENEVEIKRYGIVSDTEYVKEKRALYLRLNRDRMLKLTFEAVL